MTSDSTDEGGATQENDLPSDVGRDGGVPADAGVRQPARSTERQAAPLPSQPPPIPGQIVALVDELVAATEGGRQVPLSSNVMINKDDFLERLHRLKQDLPEELRAARWMVRERESYIARTNERAREVLTRAKARSEELVSESHIVKEAVEEANTLVRNAETDSRRIRLEAEDYAERHLSEAETVLAELLRYVQEARAALHESRPPDPDVPISQ